MYEPDAPALIVGRDGSILPDVGVVELHPVGNCPGTPHRGHVDPRTVCPLNLRAPIAVLFGDAVPATDNQIELLEQEGNTILRYDTGVRCTDCDELRAERDDLQRQLIANGFVLGGVPVHGKQCMDRMTSHWPHVWGPPGTAVWSLEHARYCAGVRGNAV